MTSRKKLAIFMSALAAIALVFGPTACQKEETAAGGAGQTELEEAGRTYEGTVKIALGKYLYVPTVQGMDIIAEGFDGTSVLDKEIRLRGEILKDRPWLFRADSIEVKEGGSYSEVYSRTAELNLDEIVDLKIREEYETLTVTDVRKADQWEGKQKVKVFGKLQDSMISFYGDNDKEIGKILVDSMTDFAKYYVAKLHLFDKMWFYLNVKETMDARTRTRSKHIFHSDVVFVGLY